MRSADNGISNEYFEYLKVDNISIENDVIERAKQNKPDAIHTIGCKYDRANNREKAIKWLGAAAAAAMGIWVSHHHSVRPYNDSSDGILKRLHLIHIRLFHFARVRIGQQRYKEAQELYQQAADLGYAHGKFRLGLCYYNHWGLNSERIDKSTGIILRDSIQIDYELAMLWFLKASIQGEKKANYYIGCMYEFGKGVPEDKQQALEWYHRSKSGGHFYADACINRLDNEGYIYTTKDNIITSCESCN